MGLDVPFFKINHKRIIMKKVILFLAFFGVVALVNANAQCSGAKASTASNEKGAACCAQSSAMKAAANDKSIEKRVSPETGEVSFVRKDVNAESGKVVYSEVEYCTKSGKFINVSPSNKSCCSKTGEASATKVSNEKAATCSGEQKAGCCDKSKSASASAQPKAANVKLVKSEK